MDVPEKTVVVGWVDAAAAGTAAVLHLSKDGSETVTKTWHGTLRPKIFRQEGDDLDGVVVRTIAPGVSVVALNCRLIPAKCTFVASTLVKWLSSHEVERIIAVGALHFAPLPRVNGDVVHQFSTSELPGLSVPSIPVDATISDALLGALLHYIRLANIPFTALVVSTTTDNVRPVASLFCFS